MAAYYKKDEVSREKVVKPNKTIIQWRRTNNPGKCKDSDNYQTEIGYNMPGTIIFVHGVNSEGEWYQSTMEQICSGLNERLNRNDLHLSNNSETKGRFTFSKNGKREKCPVIPFYWGWKGVAEKDGNADVISDYPGLYHDRKSISWGGGPFQNGCNNLLALWNKKGVQEFIYFLGEKRNVQQYNPEIDRYIVTAPSRKYMIHAAARLAHLVDTIRNDFPNEPITIVSHSQGTMITLASITMMDSRGADTVILNNSPYSFDVTLGEEFATEAADENIQTKDARLRTFKNIAKKINSSGNSPKVEEGLAPHPNVEKNTCISYTRCNPNSDDWYQWIGGTGKKGSMWFNESGESTRKDLNFNKGNIFVNFNPHDRVIGASPIQGIGWKGIPSRIISQNKSEFENVYQRVFHKNCGMSRDEINEYINKFGIKWDINEFEIPPAIGSKPYLFKFFQIRQEHAGIHTQNYLVPFSGDVEFWNPPSCRAKISGIPVLSSLSTPGPKESVWINAPQLPKTLTLDENFLQPTIRFDGFISNDNTNSSQADDFKIFIDNYPWIKENIFTEEEKKKRIELLSKKIVANPNHSTILTHPEVVKKTITYDIAIGLGQAWHDDNYWDYLLKLADWHQSDPYFRDGKLPDNTYSSPTNDIDKESIRPFDGPKKMAEALSDPNAEILKNRLSNK